jgi:hypothetical protein
MVAIQSAECRKEHIDPNQYSFPENPPQDGAPLRRGGYMNTAAMRRQWEDGRGNCAL